MVPTASWKFGVTPCNFVEFVLSFDRYKYIPRKVNSSSTDRTSINDEEIILLNLNLNLKLSFKKHKKEV